MADCPALLGAATLVTSGAGECISNAEWNIVASGVNSMRNMFMPAISGAEDYPVCTPVYLTAVGGATSDQAASCGFLLGTHAGGGRVATVTPVLCATVGEAVSPCDRVKYDTGTNDLRIDPNGELIAIEFIGANNCGAFMYYGPDLTYPVLPKITGTASWTTATITGGQVLVTNEVIVNVSLVVNNTNAYAIQMLWYVPSPTLRIVTNTAPTSNGNFQFGLKYYQNGVAMGLFSGNGYKYLGGIPAAGAESQKASMSDVLVPVTVAAGAVNTFTAEVYMPIGYTVPPEYNFIRFDGTVSTIAQIT